MTAGPACLIAAYLLGGIPFGLILYRAARGRDIRSVGSGNIGAANVARAGGWGIGLLTLAGDAAKGVASVLIARVATGAPAWEAAAALGAVAGHCFPVYLKFRGGKGVATGCGAFAFLDPAAMGVAVVVFAVAVALTRMVSAGSMLAALTFPLAAAALGGPAEVALLAGGAGALIVIRHHTNLGRIVRGEERRLGAGRRDEA